MSAERDRLPGVDHPWLVTAALRPSDPVDPSEAVVAPERAGRWPRIHRSPRDWAVDIACVVLSLGLGALALKGNADDVVRPLTAPVVLVDVVLGVVSCAVLWLRRRWPVTTAVVIAVVAAPAASSAVACLIAVFTVGVHRRLRVLLAVIGLNLVSAAVFVLMRPVKDSLVSTASWTVAIYLILIAWAMFVRARRQLLYSLRDRAERAETEQRLLAEQARRSERTRIAREMHDVLAHRITLMSLQAGALEVNPDLPPEEVTRTAALLRTTARQALDELRGVIGVLRDEPAAGGPEAVAPETPQPTLCDIDRLVDESQRSGAKIELRMRVDKAEVAPGPLGRAAYRIVQESLTNVHKHARGTATDVAVVGAPGRGLRVTVRNRLPLEGTNGATLPGAGAGLVGLAERVALSGGTLTHGPDRNGNFVVDARLEWAR